MLRLVNNNLSPLPFYGGLKYQNHRKSYAYGQVYSLITYRNNILPFQIILDKSRDDKITDTVISEVRAISFYSPQITLDITQVMLENGLELKEYNDFVILRYRGQMPVTPLHYEGRYWIEIDINNIGTLYSEIFDCVTNVDKFLYIQYWNSYNFELRRGMVDFSDHFKFHLWLNTEVGKPDYDFEEETTDRMGYSFMESQVSKKVYNFNVILPEFLCDALRIVRLCENKIIWSKNRKYEAINFTMDPDWEDQGDLASVDCSFETDTVIANIGGYVPDRLGDYDESDFNNESYNH